MKNNTAYISTTLNILTKDNIAYARTQILTEDGILYDCSRDKITKKR